MEKQTKTVSIVGGGIGGLASAILLAKQGYKVSLYEKNECLGGRASIMHKDGYTFDMGPSRYLMPDIFEEFFESIDEDIHEYLDLKQLSPSYRVFYNNGQTQNQIQITTYNGKICCNYVGLFGYNNTEEKIRNGVLAVIKNIQTGKFLFQIKKKTYNIITLCGGGVEEGENYEETIIREIKEETGLIQPKIITKLGDSVYLRYRKGDVNLLGTNDFYYVEVESDATDSISPEEQDINGNIRLDEHEVLQSISFYSHLIGWFRYKEWIGGKNYDKADNEFKHYIQTSGFGYSDETSVHLQNEGRIKSASLQHLDIYADSQRMSDLFESMEPGAGKQFLTFLDRAKIQYEIGMEFCKKNYDSIFDFFRRDIMWKGIKLNIRTTIDHYVARFFRNQLIRKIMQYTTVFLGTAPKSTPALYNIMSHCDFNMGVRYPKGGLHEIAKTLHKIGLKHGIEYHLNTEVVGCEIKDNQIINLKLRKKNSEHYDIIINTLDPSRREEYKTLRLEMLQSDPEAFGGNYEEVIARDNEYRKSRLENNTNTLLFAQDSNGKLIGTVNYTIDGYKAKIYGMYVDKDYRGLGVGKRFLDNIKKQALLLSVTKLSLHVYKTQSAAITLYTKHGFSITGEGVEDNGKGYYIMDCLIEPNDQNNISIQSDIYLINADMAWFETSILPKESQTYSISYRDKKIFAPSGFIIYAGIDKKLPNLDHHNLYFCEDRDKNFGQIFDTKELPEDPSIYVSKITHSDPTMAPEGCENLFILVPIPNGIEITDNQKEQYKNMVRKIVEQMAGEHIVGHITTASSRAEHGNQHDMADSRDLTLSTGTTSHIVVEEIFTISDFKSRYNSWKGTALGLAHPIMQTAVFRPNNISKKLNNLFYVGHNTNPGIGLPMVIISAKLALERIIKQFTL